MRKECENKILVAYAALILLMLLILGALSLLEKNLAHSLAHEGGPVEIFSAIGHFLCAIAVLYFGRSWQVRWHAALLFIAMGLRELDFHSRFTTMNISKIKFYLSPEVPFPEKIFGALILMALAYSAYRLILSAGRGWWQEIKTGRMCAYGVLLGLSFIVISKTLDGLARKLKSVGIFLSQEASTYALFLEEVLELGISLAFLLAIWCYYKCETKSSC